MLLKGMMSYYITPCNASRCIILDLNKENSEIGKENDFIFNFKMPIRLNLAWIQ